MEDFNTAAVAQEVLEDLLVQPEFGWAYLREFIPEGVEPTREQLEDLESLVMAASPMAPSTYPGPTEDSP